MAKSKSAAAAETLKQAVAAQRGGRALQAELLYLQVLDDVPEHPVALHWLGVLRCQQRDPEAGLALLDRALRAKPDYVDALNSRGNALRDLRRPAEALQSFDRVLAIEPRNADALFNSGVVLRELDRHEDAIARLERALAVSPRDAETLSDLGVSLRALGREEEALERFQQALRARPDFADALSNLGNTLKALGRIQEAIAAYRRGLALSPDNAEIHLNLGLALLATGAWPEGWREYGWRHGTRQFAGTVRTFREPLWRGEADIAGRTVLLHAEQGLGDMLMFARYVPLVAQRGARVVLEVPPRLMPLFRDMPGVAQLVAGGEPLPAFDLQCPVPALPGAFGTVPDSVPPALAYRPPAGARNWDGIASSSARLRVGIVWAGNPDYSKDRGRSADLARLAPLFAVPGVSFVSLQRDVSARDVELLAQHGIPHTGPEQRDFGDAAALVERMDLVVSVDTSVAHLAGSMGRPLWMLLSYSPDWRWGSEGERSPWYPQAKLFRQQRRGDWTAPVALMADALRRQAAGERA